MAPPGACMCVFTPHVQVCTRAKAPSGHECRSNSMLATPAELPAAHGKAGCTLPRPQAPSRL